MKLYATQCNGDRVLLTRHPPVIQAIDYTEVLDAYPRHGEPVDVRHLCRNGFRTLLGPKARGVLAHLTPTRIELTLRIIEPDKLIEQSAADREAILRLCAELDQQIPGFGPFTALG